MTDRQVLELYNCYDENRKADDSFDATHSVQLVVNKRGTIEVSCNDDWQGNTESGFGATVSVSLCREDSIKLIEFLTSPEVLPRVLGGKING